MRRFLLTIPITALFFVLNVAAQSEGAAGKVFWRGMVDDKIQLVIRGTGLEQKTVSGQAQPAGLYSFTAPLPDQPSTVGVVIREGRSKKVSVIQQPTAENEFTAIVELHDDGGGTRDYLIEIFWR